MNSQNVLIACWRWRKKIAGVRNSVREQLDMDHSVLARRKNVRSKVQIVAIVVNKLKRQHSEPSLPRRFFQRKFSAVISSALAYIQINQGWGNFFAMRRTQTILVILALPA